MTQPTTNPTDYNSNDDEIDLFELFETLWAHKIFIGLVTLAFGLAGLAYVTYKPGQPDTYTAKAVLEVGSYVTSTGEITVLELGGDLVQIVSQTAGVKAQLLRGSSSLIELDATHAQPEKANDTLVQAIDYVVKRHQAVGQKIGEDRLIRPTDMIGTIQTQKRSLFDKKTPILVISVLLGLILASMTVLLRKTYIQRKQCAEARADKGA